MNGLWFFFFFNDFSNFSPVLVNRFNSSSSVLPGKKKTISYEIIFDLLFLWNDIISDRFLIYAPLKRVQGFSHHHAELFVPSSSTFIYLFVSLFLHFQPLNSSFGLFAIENFSFIGIYVTLRFNVRMSSPRSASIPTFRLVRSIFFQPLNFTPSL